MALGHLTGYFEKVLCRRVAVSLMQLKETPTARVLSEPRPSGSGPTLEPSRAGPINPARSEPAVAPPRVSEPPPALSRPAAAAPAPIDVEAAKTNPLVQRAAELLGAKIVRITARADAPPAQQP